LLRILTAGESHGKSLAGIIEGFPSNVAINIDEIHQDLARRQQGYGRGGRMKIEQDRIEILSGVRDGKTLGSPIAFLIRNKDYENWESYMDPMEADTETKKVTNPRPGHADLIGALKYGFEDVRNVLERSSARETAVRVAAGSFVKQLLKNFQIQSAVHVTAIGEIAVNEKPRSFEEIREAEDSPVRCVDPVIGQRMMETIDAAKKEGDSLGGIFEIYIQGLPVGLGSYVQWDRKLDAKLAYALMSIQAIKGVEFGYGFKNAQKPGSQ